MSLVVCHRGALAMKSCNVQQKAAHLFTNCSTTHSSPGFSKMFSKTKAFEVTPDAHMSVYKRLSPATATYRLKLQGVGPLPNIVVRT